MQISNTFAACLWKSRLLWGNILGLNGSGVVLKVFGNRIILSRKFSQPLVENLRNGERSFVEHSGQNLYLSCFKRVRDLAGELSTG